MTLVSYVLNDKKMFVYISVKGHSGYKRNGNDIVCSSISSIVNGTINFLEEEYKKGAKINLDKLKPEIEIIIKEGTNKKEQKEIQLIIKMMLFQLKNIEKKYKKNLKIIPKNNV